MKIIHIIPSLNMGGAEKFCVDLSNNMSVNNKIILCVLHKINKESILYKRLDEKINIISFEKKLGLDFILFIKLKKFLDKEKPDILNTHLSGLFYSLLFCLTNDKLPIFHTIHNEAKKETSTLKRLINNQLFRFNKVTPIGISKSIGETIKDEYKLKKIEIIENGTSKIVTTNELENVKKEIFKLKDFSSQKVLINIARISPQKNQKLLIKAVKELKNIILIIIGEVTIENQSLYKEISQISNNVHFLGIKNNIGDYLYCSDIFCLSSEYEGLPITLLEAMSLGKICISTPVGGIPDVIKDKSNGFLTDDLSLINYTNKIKEIISLSQEEVNNIESSAKLTYQKNYSISRTSANYLELYNIGKNKNV